MQVNSLSLTAALALLLPVVAAAGQSTTFTDGKPGASQLGQLNLLTTAGDNRGTVPSATTLFDPSAVAVDPSSGKVFVADTGNNRVLRFSSTTALANGAAAESVLGQANFITTAGTVSQSRFNDPRSICCDENGRLWVLDGNRILRFDGASNLANGANANGVLGQPNYTSTAVNNGQNGIGDPAAISVSVTGALWVSSPGLSRVTRFANAAAKVDGASADSVLGQVNFATSAAATTRAGLTGPTGLTLDLAGNLYLADTGNHRVLVFKDADTGANGRNADIVLGQLVDTSADIGFGTFGMNDPVSVTINPLGMLMVGDRGNDRVLLFKNAANKGDGGAADGVLGQSDLETPTVLSVDRLFDTVAGLWADGENRLWVADPGYARVMRFETDSFQPDAKIGSKPTSLRGNAIYNTTGAGQRATIMISGKKTAKAYLALENDGDVIDDLTLSGPAGSRMIRLTYLQTGGGNVTAPVRTGSLTLEEVDPGQSIAFQLIAKGEPKFKLRKSKYKARMSAASASDGERDSLECLVEKRP